MSVCRPAGDLPWPPAACRTLEDLAPDRGLAKHHCWLPALCEAGDSSPWGFSVRADVCEWVHEVVADAQSTKWVRQLGPK